MDNYKLVMISILYFKTWEKYNFLFFFFENMLGKLWGFDYIHENKTFFVFLKEEINLKNFEFYFEMFQKKLGVLISDMYHIV
jgi:hypothetical protein